MKNFHKKRSDYYESASIKVFLLLPVALIIERVKLNFNIFFSHKILFYKVC